MKDIIKRFSLFTWVYASLLGGMLVCGTLSSILNLCYGLFMPCLIWGCIGYLGGSLIKRSSKVKELITYITNLQGSEF